MGARPVRKARGPRCHKNGIATPRTHARTHARMHTFTHLLVLVFLLNEARERVALPLALGRARRKGDHVAHVGRVLLIVHRKLLRDLVLLGVLGVLHLSLDEHVRSLVCRRNHNAASFLRGEKQGRRRRHERELLAHNRGVGWQGKSPSGAREGQRGGTGHAGGMGSSMRRAGRSFGTRGAATRPNRQGRVLGSLLEALSPPRRPTPRHAPPRRAPSLRHPRGVENDARLARKRRCTSPARARGGCAGALKVTPRGRRTNSASAPHSAPPISKAAKDHPHGTPAARRRATRCPRARTQARGSHPLSALTLHSARGQKKRARTSAPVARSAAHARLPVTGRGGLRCGYGYRQRLEPASMQPRPPPRVAPRRYAGPVFRSICGERGSGVRGRRVLGRRAARHRARTGRGGCAGEAWELSLAWLGLGPGPRRRAACVRGRRLRSADQQ